MADKPYIKAYQDYKSGMSYADISKKYKVSLATVKSWYTRHWKSMQEQEAEYADDQEVCNKDADSMQDGMHRKPRNPTAALGAAIVDQAVSNQVQMIQSGSLYQYDADNLPEIEPKQARFVREYCIDLNQRQAAIRAGYSINNADNIASLLMRDAKVSMHVQAALAAASSRTGLNVDRIHRELARIVLANPAKVIASDGSLLADASEDDLAAVQSVKVKCVGFDRETGEAMYEREVRFHDKNKAIELYMKAAGMLIERKQVDVHTQVSSMTKEEREKEIAELLAKREQQTIDVESL